jgi:hypothetical protein
VDIDAVLGGLYELVVPHLTEKQRRLLAGAGAKVLGRGGGAGWPASAGCPARRCTPGVRELDEPPDPGGRVRRRGGGPKRLVERQPGLLEALDALVDPDTRGDPQSPLPWTCKSARELADALGARLSGLRRHGRAAAQAAALHAAADPKTEEGAQHPDRDAQFRYINAQAKQY